ncbi:alpha-N-arabinofuranosidase [Parabacteroides sp. PFB2-12]|uniref:alpha-L-arabinofuranosidase C-terminal domain-containing protein n=1 Tax=unclassified Parabacteroides TaxID=2649774 RepID=UPI002475D9E3|nr:MULTISPECIES: alpha-L-arabinofuranosidase C-terminal domain-containing protein [unclassified Parabacteroides]MDH6342757.1 alpha-N-arabinofuranosidase [Parabacteroides sp. PM6-13]MDH6391475.1 alpha-N-arabinofuranosidase [Parabacteroides sp. PFB2-12]
MNTQFCYPFREKIRYAFVSIALLAVHVSMFGQATPAKDIEATVHLEQTNAPIHPFMYGMFTELLHNMFENGIWAEMLSDRKFFYAVDNSETLEPRNTRRHQLRWRPVGAASGVTMDKDNVYVGKQSPKITLNGGIPNGIQQKGLWLRQGKGYEGRIVLSGDPQVKVTVSLVWGTKANERESIVIDRLSKDYKKFPFHFYPKGDTNEGYIEITGEGTGSFNIGAVSLMPDDNLHGFRKDIVEILKSVGATIYRWPGGNFLANYDWRHGIGDIDRRPPRYDYAWFTVESNDVGTDEFLTLCDLIDTEPYLVVNSGLGDAYSAAQWVEYVNGDKDTPMGMWRSANGHPEPYQVKYWGIGNEMYGEWQIGYMSSWHYTLKHNFFAEEMRAKDPNIKLIASGATIYETGTTARHHRKPLQMKLPIEYLSQDDWTGMLLTNSLENIDYMAEHIYTYFNGYFDQEKQDWVAVRDTLVDLVRRTPNRIKGMIESMEEYQKRIPEVREKPTPFWVDEWVAGEGRGLKTTIGVAAALHEFMRHADLIMMGAYTGFNGLYRYNDVDAVISTNGLLFKLFLEHHGTRMVNLTGNSPQRELTGTIGVDIPKEISGSPTYPLDVLATVNEDKTKLTVSIVNPTYTEQKIKLHYKGGSIGKEATLYSLAPTIVTDDNSPEQPNKVEVEVSRSKVKQEVEVPPHSILLYEYDLTNK